MLKMNETRPKLEELRALLAEPRDVKGDLVRDWVTVFDWSDPPELCSALVEAIRNRCAKARDWCENRCEKREAGENKCWNCFLNMMCEWDEENPLGEGSVQLIDDLMRKVDV